MKRRKAMQVSLTPGQALYILEKAIADRKLSRRDVAQYQGEMTREIRDLEERLASLNAAGAREARLPVRRSGPGKRAAAAPRQRAQRAARPKREITPERAESMRVQGAYLALLAQIPAAKRDQFKKLAREDSREAAIKKMRDLLGK